MKTFEDFGMNKTLMSIQAMFNKAATHLLEQGQQSLVMDGGAERCLYRAPNGNMCAVGPLIPTRLYRAFLENKGVTASEITEVLAAAGVLPDPITITFEQRRDYDLRLKILGALQNIHDFAKPVYWMYKLNELAEFYGLNTEAIFWNMPSSKSYLNK